MPLQDQTVRTSKPSLAHILQNSQMANLIRVLNPPPRSSARADFANGHIRYTLNPSQFRRLCLWHFNTRHHAPLQTSYAEPCSPNLGQGSNVEVTYSISIQPSEGMFAMYKSSFRFFLLFQTISHLSLKDSRFFLSPLCISSLPFPPTACQPRSLSLYTRISSLLCLALYSIYIYGQQSGPPENELGYLLSHPAICHDSCDLTGVKHGISPIFLNLWLYSRGPVGQSSLRLESRKHTCSD
jgi:hypothetical protein